MVVVQGRAVFLVAELDEELDDGEVPQLGSEMEIGVGVALGRGKVWVVKEVRVGSEDALDEERVVGVDCAPETDGWVYPGLGR